MKTVEIQISGNKTAVPVGCHLRWDVGTKSRLVREIVNTDFASAEDKKDRIILWAEEYRVRPESIKNWVKKYRYTYDSSMHAIDGTVIWSSTVITGPKLDPLLDRLEQIRLLSAKAIEDAETAPYSTHSAKDTKAGNPTNLEEIVSVVVQE